LAAGFDHSFLGVGREPGAQYGDFVAVAPGVKDTDDAQKGNHPEIHALHIFEIAVPAPPVQDGINGMDKWSAAKSNMEVTRTKLT
jgi:hypothetical protein